MGHPQVRQPGKREVRDYRGGATFLADEFTGLPLTTERTATRIHENIKYASPPPRLRKGRFRLVPLPPAGDFFPNRLRIITMWQKSLAMRSLMTDLRSLLRSLGVLATVAVAPMTFAQQVTFSPYIQLGDNGPLGPTDQIVIAWQTNESSPAASA